MKWRAGPTADLSRLPVSLDLRAISLAEGVRAAFAVAAIMLLDEWLGLPLLVEAALGALLTCLCDGGGPVRRRVPTLLSFATLGTIVVTGFGLLRPLGLPLAIPLATLAIAAFSFARAWGPAPMQVGNLLIVVTVLSLDAAEPPRTILALGALFAAGSVWAVLLTLVIWRIHPYRPARRALADVFRRLGALATDLTTLLDAGHPPRWAEHARAHRRHVRDGIEAARVLVLDTVRIRGSGTIRARQSVIQVEAADQLFGVIIALSDILEHAGAPTRAIAAQSLPALRLLLAATADATAQDHPSDDPAARTVLTTLLDRVAAMRADPALATLSAALVSRLRIALLLTTPAGLQPGRDGTADRAPLRERLLLPIRANLVRSSPILRHALRVGAVTGPVLALTLASGNAYAHWLTITLVLTMQPFFANAWQRAIERCAGTVLGGIAAAAIASLVHSPLATTLVLAPLVIAAFTTRAVSYGTFLFFLTPMVVLLSELGSPGSSEFVIAAARAAYTVAGGACAILANTLLWPSWEHLRIRTATQAALRAHAAYAALELAALSNPASADPAALEAVRRTAGIATNDLETALNRALQEPRQRARREAETGLLVDAALRRLAGRLLALQHDPAQAGSDRALLDAWRAWLARAFDALQSRHALPDEPPPEADHPALGRIARQLQLIAGALSPASAVPPPAPTPAPTA